jgi:hypothetical protein
MKVRDPSIYLKFHRTILERKKAWINKRIVLKKEEDIKLVIPIRWLLLSGICGESCLENRFLIASGWKNIMGSGPLFP